jgi:hypothetical protein
MFTSRNSITGSLFCSVLICLVASLQAAGQADKKGAPEDQQAVLKSLLKEVQLLRLALERNNIIAHRSEILVGRLQAQQQRVDRLARDLEEARKQIAEIRYDPAQAAEMLEEVEKKVEAGVLDSANLKAIKAEMAQQERMRERLVERERILAYELEVEKSGLSELKVRLDALERSFDEAEESGKRPPKKSR